MSILAIRASRDVLFVTMMTEPIIALSATGDRWHIARDAEFALCGITAPGRRYYGDDDHHLNRMPDWMRLHPYICKRCLHIQEKHDD